MSWTSMSDILAILKLIPGPKKRSKGKSNLVPHYAINCDFLGRAWRSGSRSIRSKHTAQIL